MLSSSFKEISLMSDCKGVKLMMKVINAGKYFIGREIACVPSLYVKKAPKTEREYAWKPNVHPSSQQFPHGSVIKRFLLTLPCLDRHL